MSKRQHFPTLLCILWPLCPSTASSAMFPEMGGGGGREGEGNWYSRSGSVFVFPANLRCTLGKQNSCVYWSLFLYLSVIYMYVSTWVHANMYVKKCTCVCQTKVLSALPMGLHLFLWVRASLWTWGWAGSQQATALFPVCPPWGCRSRGRWDAWLVSWVLGSKFMLNSKCW